MATRPNGLGRNLAGILDSTRPLAVDRNDGGLGRLLGGPAAPTPPRLREFVTETALAAIAEGFGAEAVAIARVDGADDAVISSRLPPSWDESSSLTFELHGQLWGLLERRGRLVSTTAVAAVGSRVIEEPRETSHELLLGGRPTWLGWQSTAAGDLAAAVVRATPFSDAERTALGRLVRTVAVAIGGRRATPVPSADISVVVTAKEDRWRAEAIVVTDGKRRRAIAEAEDQELAVARAAAKFCRVPAEVGFAGRTELDGVSVTLVVVNDKHNAPFLGLSVSEPGRVEATAEAVFSAVSAMDGPLGPNGSPRR
ncbi:MAG: hypothetical protein AAF962_20130 [Actinomycetota bacterium]